MAIKFHAYCGNCRNMNIMENESKNNQKKKDKESENMNALLHLHKVTAMMNAAGMKIFLRECNGKLSCHAVAST